MCYAQSNVTYMHPNSINAMIARADRAISDNNRALAEHLIRRIYAFYDREAQIYLVDARERISQIPPRNRHSGPNFEDQLVD